MKTIIIILLSLAIEACSQSMECTKQPIEYQYFAPGTVDAKALKELINRGPVKFSSGEYDFQGANINIDSRMHLQGVSGTRFVNGGRFLINGSLYLDSIHWAGWNHLVVGEKKAKTIEWIITNCKMEDFGRGFIQAPLDTAGIIFKELVIKNNTVISSRPNGQAFCIQGLIESAQVSGNKFLGMDPSYICALVLGSPADNRESGNINVYDNYWNLWSKSNIDGGVDNCLIYAGKNSAIYDNVFDSISTDAIYIRGGGFKVYNNKINAVNSNQDAGLITSKGVDYPHDSIYHNYIISDNKPAFYSEKIGITYFANNYYKGLTRKVIDIHATLGSNKRSETAHIQHNTLINTRPRGGVLIGLKNTANVTINNNLLVANGYILSTFSGADGTNSIINLVYHENGIQTLGPESYGLKADTISMKDNYGQLGDHRFMEGFVK